MQHLYARKLLRSLFVVLACFSYLIQAQDIDCAQLGSNISNLQSQLDMCCANIKGQESNFQSCCDELRSSLDSLKAQFECTSEECCTVKFLTKVQELNDVDTADWSHDGKFVAIGLNTKVNLSGGDSIDPKVLKIYELEGSHLVLKAETSIGNQIGQVAVVRWHPTKYRLAVGRSDIDDSDEDHLHIFDFNPSTNALKEVDHAEGVDVYAVAWRSKPLDETESSSSDSSSSSSSSSDEDFVLAVGRATCNKSYELVTFNVAEAGSLSGPFPSKGVDTDGQISNKALDWDVTSRFLVVGVQLSSDNKVLQVYEYNPQTHGLKLNARAHVPSVPGHAKTKSTVLAVDWNPSNECKGLIAVGLKSCSKNPAEQLLQVFEHNALSGTLTYRNGVPGLKKSVYSVNWKDCECLSLGKGGGVSSGGEFRTYRYDADTSSLVLESSFDDFKNQSVQEVRWSPNSQFILNGSADNYLSVYNAITECKKISFCQFLTDIEVIQSKVNCILSKVCDLDCLGSCSPQMENCCSKIEAEIQNVEITLCSKIERLDKNLETCCSVIESLIANSQFTIDSKIDLIRSDTCLALTDCCSVVDVIDHRTFTILSKVTDLELNVETCCSVLEQMITNFSINAEIDFQTTVSLIHDAQFTLCSKIENISFQTCCSVLEQLITNFSINAEIDFQTTFSLIHDAQFTLCSKIENIDFAPFCDCVIPVEKCCATVLSKVDVIDQTAETILSKVCDIQSAIDNLVFPDCCSAVDVIDLRTETILSKVCNIDVEVHSGFYSVCSKLEQIQTSINNLTVNVDIGTINVNCDTSAIEALQYTLVSAIDNINVHVGTVNVNCDFSVIEGQLETCCSTVDQINIRTETIISTVNQININLANDAFTLCSKIENLTDSFCFEHILLKGPVVTINAPGSYQLCGDVGVVFINASRVKLDLQQFSVQGNGTQGIVFATDVSDVEIFNGVVENIQVAQSGIGIDIPSSTDVTIHDVIIRNWATGAQLSSSQRLSLENIIISNCSGDAINLISVTSTAQDVELQNVKSFGNGNGLSVNSVSALRVKNSQFNNNTMNGVQITDVRCGDFINCTADLNGMDGYSIQVPALLIGQALFRDCTACGNGGNGYNQTNVTKTQFFNCIAEGNTANGFVTNDANGSIFIQGCRSQGNGAIGFSDVSGADHHLYLTNSACDNGTANFDIGSNLAVVTSPNNARGMQNVDCSITTTDEVPEILSKVCLLEENFNTCCSVIESLLTTVTSSVCPNIIQLGGPGVVINNPGNYVLCNNVLGSSPALIVTASNVHVNLNNFSVLSTAPNQPGIIIGPNVSNVEIFGGFVQNTTAQGSLLTTDFGISITGGGNTDIYISDVIVTGYYNGIVLSNNVNNVIMNNVQINNCANNGLDIGGSQAVAVSDCVINNNLNAGISLDNTNQTQALRGITFNNVQVSKCNFYGFYCFGGQDISIQNSLFFNNVSTNPAFVTSGYGAFVEGSQGINFVSCSFNINDIGGFTGVGVNGLSVNNCIFNGNGRGQTPVTNPGQNMGAYIEDCVAVNFSACVANDNNGEGFSAQCATTGCLAAYTDCISQRNAGAGFREQDAGFTGVPPSNKVYYNNCVAQGNFDNETCIQCFLEGNGFSMEGAHSQAYVQNCKAAGNTNIGFNDTGLPTASHVYFANTSCENAIANYSTIIGETLTSGQIKGPNDALAYQNVDCGLTSTNATPNDEIVISLLENIEVNLSTCCSEIEQLITNFSINVALDFQTTISAITDAQYTIDSKIDEIKECCSLVIMGQSFASQLMNTCCSNVDMISFNLDLVTSKIDFVISITYSDVADCCSVVDAINLTTQTILSKIDSLNTDLETCCSKIENDISNLQFTLSSKIDNIVTVTCVSPIIENCCSVVDEIDLITQTILSKIDNLNTDFETCCSKIESDLINVQFTLASKIDEIRTTTCVNVTVNVPDCCSVVDVIDLRTETILSKIDTINTNFETCCSKIELDIMNSQFTLASKIDEIRTTTCVNVTVNVPDCCSVVDVIDLRTETILSKVCALEQSLETCCSTLEGLIIQVPSFVVDAVETCCSQIDSLIVNLDFTLNSRIDQIHTSTCPVITDCCSVVDVIDQRTITILSKVCLLDPELKTCCSTIEALIVNTQFTLESKIDEIRTSTCPVFTDCCSQVDAIDKNLKTCCSILENLVINIATCCSDLQSDLESCCAQLHSDVESCCGALSSDLDACCSGLSSDIEACCKSLQSDIDSCCSDLQNDIESCCGALGSDIESCCSQLNGNIESCCGELHSQIQTCCDEIICRLDGSVDEQILTKVCDIYDCVYDVDSCDKPVCIKDRVKTILKKVCTIESKIDAIDFNCDNVTINVTCDIDQTILAKVCLLDIKADEIYKKIDTINNENNPCKSKLIMSGTTISAAGTYCLGASLANQDIKVDLGSAASVVLDLNGYVVDDIKVSSDKAGVVKNLVIKNGKAVSNITTDSKYGLSNASLHLENVSAQCVNLVKARGVNLSANGYIEALKIAGSEINANLEGSVVKSLNVQTHSKDVSVKNVRVVDYVTIHPESQYITLENVDIGIDGNGELIVDNGTGISINNVTARGISFCNNCKDCLVRDSKCYVGGFKIFNGENIVCIDCESSGNTSGAGFASSNSIATTFEHCNATENEEGFAFASDQSSNIVRCTAKKNSKNGFKDRESMGCSISECQAIGNGLNGFNYLAATHKAQLNPTAYYLNFASNNSGVNYSVLNSISAPVKLLTDVRQYGDNLAATLP